MREKANIAQKTLLAEQLNPQEEEEVAATEEVVEAVTEADLVIEAVEVVTEADPVTEAEIEDLHVKPKEEQ